MILLPAILALSKVLGHSTLDFLEARGNHLANVSTGLLPFKEPSVARLRVSFFKSVTITAASVRADLTPDTLPRKSIGRLAHFPLVLWDFSFPSGLQPPRQLHALNTDFSVLLKRCENFVTKCSKRISGDSQNGSKFQKVLLVVVWKMAFGTADL